MSKTVKCKECGRPGANAHYKMHPQCYHTYCSRTAAPPTERKIRTLSCHWNSRIKDLIYWYPRRCDMALMHDALTGKKPRLKLPSESGYPIVFEPSFKEELEKRGYDITTFRFSVKLKKEASSHGK